jgi:hypothetical protein
MAPSWAKEVKAESFDGCGMKVLWLAASKGANCEVEWSLGMYLPQGGDQLSV